MNSSHSLYPTQFVRGVGMRDAVTATWWAVVEQDLPFVPAPHFDYVLDNGIEIDHRSIQTVTWRGDDGFRVILNDLTRAASTIDAERHDMERDGWVIQDVLD